ncbi:MAG: thioredoxin [Mediterranea sp.]|jgi:thioredoxin 1|nr:thioredoxin [Mediterranea sp.]
MALEITDSNNLNYLNGDKPVVIDFWAPWCGPCKAIGPVIEELAHEYEDQAVIGKCNVDENTDLPAQYGIRSIPTIIFFKNGEVVDKQVGAATKSALADKIKALF